MAKSGTDDLVLERVQLKRKVKLEEIDDNMKRKIEERILKIEEEIGDEIASKFYKDIVTTLKDLGDEDDTLSGSGRKKVWSLMKKRYPKVTPVIPVGKKDKGGNVVTNHVGLKHLYLDTYIHRLRNRPMKTDNQEIKDLKTQLFDLRLKFLKVKAQNHGV